MIYDSLTKEQLISELQKRDEQLKKLQDFSNPITNEIKQNSSSEHEDKLKESQRVAKIGHYSFDVKKNIWTSSDQLNKIFGISKEFKRDSLGWLSLVHPDFMEVMREHLLVHVIQNKNQFNKEYKIITTDTKEEKWIHGLGNLSFNDKGEPIEMFGTIQDITERKLIELELEEREFNLKESQRVAKIGHYLINRKKQEIKTSEQLKEIFELDEEFQFDFNSWFAFVHPDFVEELEDLYHKYLVDNKEPFIYDYKIITAKTKKVKWIHSRANYKINEKGETEEIFGTIQDITERKLIEKELEEKDKNLEESQRVAKIGHLYVDSENEVVKSSKQLKDIFEIEEELKFDLESWLLSIHPDYKDYLKKLYLEEVTQNKKEYDLEYKIITLNTKQEKWVHEKGHPEYNNNGDFIGLFATIQDITERKLIELAHRASEEKHQKLFDKSLDAIFVAEIESGRFVDANKAAEKITGFSLEEMRSISLQMFISLTKTEQAVNLEKILAANEIIDMGEIEFLHRDGTPRIANLSILPINTKYIFGIAADLTEKKKIERENIEAKNQAMASDKMKTEFLAQMSHEIRSPINVIVSFLSLIKEETKLLGNDVIDSSFISIESSTKRIIRTIDLILNMSDLQLGTYSVTKKEVAFSDLLTILYNEYKGIAERKNLNLKIKMDITNDNFYTDDYALRQIIANLIDNAIKYTNEGFVQMKFCEKENDYIFEIEDSGIGISEDFVSQIFSAFSQETQGYTRRFDGTGLGLSLVKKYCQLINSKIEVKSRKNIGSTFTLTIPKD